MYAGGSLESPSWRSYFLQTTISGHYSDRMPLQIRELLLTSYIIVYQIKDYLVTKLQNRCLRVDLDIRSSLRYHNANGAQRTI